MSTSTAQDARSSRGLAERFAGHPMVVSAGVALYLVAAHIFFSLYLTGRFTFTVQSLAAELTLALGMALAIGFVWDRKDRMLEQRNAYLHSMLDGIPDPVAVIDPQGRVSDANPAFRRWFHVGAPPSSEPAHRTLDDIIELDDSNQDVFDNALASGRERGRHGPVEVTVITRGGPRHVVANIIRLDPTGRDTSVLVLLSDLTHTIEAEKLASLGTLVAGVAHEINNPLGALRANTELALMALDDAHGHVAKTAAAGPLGEARSFIEANLRSIDRIAATTKALKEVSRGRPGETANLDINAAAREVLQVLRPGIKHGTVIETALSPDVRPVQCAPHEVHQVLLNLIKNGVEALERDDGTAPGTIRVSTETDGLWISIHVDDSGPGVPREDRHAIFDPFYTTKHHGTGLGLAICRSIARNHGGALFLRDSSLGGARFTLKLPTTPPADRPATDWTQARSRHGINTRSTTNEATA